SLPEKREIAEPAEEQGGQEKDDAPRPAAAREPENGAGEEGDEQRFRCHRQRLEGHKMTGEVHRAHDQERDQRWQGGTVLGRGHVLCPLTFSGAFTLGVPTSCAAAARAGGPT